MPSMVVYATLPVTGILRSLPKVREVTRAGEPVTPIHDPHINQDADVAL